MTGAPTLRSTNPRSLGAWRCSINTPSRTNSWCGQVATASSGAPARRRLSRCPLRSSRNTFDVLQLEAPVLCCLRVLLTIHGREEHRLWPHPERAVSVEFAIDHNLLASLGVARNVLDEVGVALEVAVFQPQLAAPSPRPLPRAPAPGTPSRGPCTCRTWLPHRSCA